MTGAIVAFVHEAFVYARHDDLLATIRVIAGEASDSGTPLIVMADEPSASMLRSAFGAGARAR